MDNISVKVNKFRDPSLAAVVCIYVALAFFVSSIHEPWADEAHAWLIARDASLYDLLFKLPHGEGNPSLWHLALILPAKYLSYDSLGYISLLLGLLGVIVFVYFSPFPLPIKLIFPFTYFVFYQYTIITRSYSLFPVLMFSIAALYKYRFEKVFIYTFALALLANTHLFGTFVVASLSCLYFVELLQRWHKLSANCKRNNLICIGILLFIFCFIAYQILPIQHRTLTRNYFDLSHTAWAVESSLNISFTDVFILSASIFLISGFWFWQHKVLSIYFILLGPLFAFFSIKYFNPWHTGLLFLIWMFVLWIALERKDDVRAQSLRPYAHKAIEACIYVVFGFHIYWAAAASYSDYHGNYSCGKLVAQVLKQSNVREGHVYGKHYHTVEVSPYFDKKLFYNINPGTNLSHWTWFLPDKFDDLHKVVATQPDAIVLGHKYRENEFDGYIRKNFKAYIFWKDGEDQSNHCTVYVKEGLGLEGQSQ